MNLKVQKKLIAKILKVSPKRIQFNVDHLDKIKEAVTRSGLRGLLSDGYVVKKQAQGISKGRFNKIQDQKKKGRRRGAGTRKGRAGARGEDRKSLWIIKVRLQRAFIKELKEKSILSDAVAKNLLAKVKGGYFRSKNHIKIYIRDHQLANQN